MSAESSEGEFENVSNNEGLGAAAAAAPVQGNAVANLAAQLERTGLASSKGDDDDVSPAGPPPAELVAPAAAAAAAAAAPAVTTEARTKTKAMQIQNAVRQDLKAGLAAAGSKTGAAVTEIAHLTSVRKTKGEDAYQSAKADYLKDPTAYRKRVMNAKKAAAAAAPANGKPAKTKKAPAAANGNGSKTRKAPASKTAAAALAAAAAADKIAANAAAKAAKLREEAERRAANEARAAEEKRKKNEAATAKAAAKAAKAPKAPANANAELLKSLFNKGRVPPTFLAAFKTLKASNYKDLSPEAFKKICEICQSGRKTGTKKNKGNANGNATAAAATNAPANNA